MTRHPPLAAALLALALAGCSGPADQQPAEQAPEPRAATEPTTAAPPSQAVADESSTRGGDGSAIALTPLAPAEIDAAALKGELACSFSSDGGAPLLFARGNVASTDPAFGLVKIGDYVERVAAPGGFDAMIKGATFSGRGTTIRIAITGPATGGGESPPRPATLTFDRADGAQPTFRGQWTCGP